MTDVFNWDQMDSTGEMAGVGRLLVRAAGAIN